MGRWNGLPAKSLNCRRHRVPPGCIPQRGLFANLCWCRACDEQEARRLKLKTSGPSGPIPWLPPGLTVLRINYCGHCGFRRCPCATNHLFTCSASDAPGQEGSHYR